MDQAYSMIASSDTFDDTLGPLAWPGQTGVRAWMSMRRWPPGLADRLPGGLPVRSDAPYDDVNLGDHVGDDPAIVAQHRKALALVLGAHPFWLQQVHGHRVVRLGQGAADGWLVDGQAWDPAEPVQADGSWTTEPGLACTVMVADCLPVLLAAPGRRGVAALHAGWRGLAGAGAMAGRGVLETGVAALCEGTGSAPADLQAWLGPCIGPSAFEVGADVLQGFGVDTGDPNIARAVPFFEPVASCSSPRKWLADLAGLARHRLAALGVAQVAGGHWCTASDASRFFSFRRDGVTGRQAACIWLDRS
jgi:YfiH family protein